MYTTIAFLTIIFLLHFFLRRSEKRKLEQIFAGRQPLPPKDYFARYFAESGAPEYIVVGVREVLEEQLGADLSRLSAEDDFSGNLKLFLDLDSMADVEIICALEKRFGIELTDQEAEAMRSIRDIVCTVQRKVLNA
jgi:acyl carrier protein